MSKALVALETIADDIVFDLGYSTSDFKFSILRKLMAGYRDVYLYVDQSFCVKTVKLVYDNVISLPSDYVYATKVGVLRNGRIAVMMLDTSIRRETLTQQQTEANLNCVWDGGTWGEQYVFYNWWNGLSLGELYGIGGVVNCNGYYNIDQKSGEIYIGSLLPDDAEIVVEYKSDGTEDGLTLVPVEQWNCLKYYALAEWYSGKNQGLSEYNRLAYEREYNKVKRLYGFRTSLFMGDTLLGLYESAPR